VVSGSSAGGHLALMVGLLNAESDHPCRADAAPDAVVNWYGITDIEAVDEYLVESRAERNFAQLWVGDRDRIGEISSRYSPLSLISRNAPPIITIHGTADTTVPYTQADALHAALQTRNRLVSLEDGTHGGFSDAQYQDAISAIFEFLGE
jgi:acetyl esterase/lipase